MSNYATGVAVGAAAGAAEGHAAARRVECRMIVDNYNATTATIEQRRDYADCVNFLYPDPLTGGQLIFVKVLIALVLAGGLAEVWREWGSRDYVGRFMGFLMGAILTAVVLGVALLVVAGVVFLFR